MSVRTQSGGRLPQSVEGKCTECHSSLRGPSSVCAFPHNLAFPSLHHPFFPPLLCIKGTTIMYTRVFLSLSSQTQSLLLWTLLLFSILILPGFWTLKLALGGFLMLFRPLAQGAEAPAAPLEANYKVKSGKSSGCGSNASVKGSADHSGNAKEEQWASEGLLALAALARDGSAALSDTLVGLGLTAQTPPVKASKKDRSSSSTVVTTYGNLPSSSSSSSASSSSWRSFSSAAKQKTKSSSAKRPLPVPGSVAAAVEESVAASEVQSSASASSALPPLQQPSTQRQPRPLPVPPRAPTAIVRPSPSRGHALDLSGETTVASATASHRTEPAWERGPSGYFHRVEVAKKFVKRTFSGANVPVNVVPVGGSSAEERFD